MQEGDIEATAKDIKLRAGFPETLQRALDRGHQVHVVSVNWSALLIKAVLSGFPCRIVADTDAADAVGNSSVRSGGIVRIHANALDMQLGTSTGAIVRHVQGPLDKGNVFEDILLDHAASTGNPLICQRTAVYHACTAVRSSILCMQISDVLGVLGILHRMALGTCIVVTTRVVGSTQQSPCNSSLQQGLHSTHLMLLLVLLFLASLSF